jgi:hypothetical protein
MERLCFPLPVNFPTKFVLLGFHSLPRRLVIHSHS